MQSDWKLTSEECIKALEAGCFMGKGCIGDLDCHECIVANAQAVKLLQYLIELGRNHRSESIYYGHFQSMLADIQEVLGE